jgi:hypothetical protein
MLVEAKQICTGIWKINISLEISLQIIWKKTKKISARSGTSSFYYHIIVALGVHCDVYKSSYTIS